LLDETGKGRDPGSDSSKTLAETVLQTINSIVLVANSNGEILYASPSVKAILGYEPEDLLGMKYWNTPSPDPELRKKHFQRIAAIARGDEPVADAPYAVKMLTREGEERWILWRDARATGDLVVGAGQDVTELRRTQEELKRREEEIGAVFERANDGMLVVDQNFRYVDANSAACELFGLSKEEILGREVGSVVASKVGIQGLRRAMELTGEALEEVDYQIGDGAKRKLECRLTANIRPGFHLVIIRDITLRKVLEQQLAESQRLEAVGRLAGGVAHEFNNMLTAITGYAELIVKKSTPEQAIQKYAQGIVTAASRAAQTTHQLLAFSRRQVVQPKLLALNEVIRNTVELLQRMVGDDIQVILRLNENCGPVRLDPNQLSQVLINLGLNARESMTRGGKLIIETNPAQLDHAYLTKHVQVKPGSYALISVSDTGIGIEPELQAHIFEPFFTTKEQGEGTGLGLATVYGIVRQNDGHIWVYSEPGAGTTFKVYLPTSREGEDISTQRGAEDRNAATILVIEDDMATRQVIVNSLREQGYTVLQSADGGEALSVCEAFEGSLDLVITDLGAPAMSGEDLRAYFALKHSKARLLHMSGYSEQKLKATHELPPDVEFLQKPFAISELIQKVREALG
jgi:two-component system, cell cycle sensor histidine kinase and response regulator CckA